MPLDAIVARCVDEVRARALPHDYVPNDIAAGELSDGGPAHGGVTNVAPS